MSPIAPPGTESKDVTLVFTDVQGSTEIWEQLGDDFQPLLDLHDTMMRRAIAGNAGYEVKTEGDAFMVAFARADQAVSFCTDVQSWLAKLDFGGHQIRVRMGAHMGTPLCRPDPNTGRMDYFGPMVNRSARIASAGHGGQIVISQAVRKAIEERTDLQDLGDHSLRGVHERFRLWQVGAGEFPPLRTAQVRRDTLPAEPDPFFGRQTELARLAELGSPHRVVTLVGPGGMGKSRLAIHAGRGLGKRLGGGAAYVDLSQTTSRDALVLAVAAAVGTNAAGDAEDRIGRILHARGNNLLVLDAPDRIADPLAPLVAKWLDAAPGLVVLATAHAPLSLPDEQVLPLAPLSPDAGQQLFLDRATGHISDKDLAAVAAIVHKLDQLPLAIELAAARIALITPIQLLTHLKDRFKVLRGRGSQSLQAALDGSWDVLEPWEQAAWAQSAVFEGGFTAATGSEVIDLSEWPDAPWWLDVLQTLIERGLLRLTDGDRRLGNLATLKAYALRKLGEPNAIRTPQGASWSGAAREQQTRQRHADWAMQFGTNQAILAQNGVNGLDRFHELQTERHNLMAAAQWALTQDDAAAAQGTASAVWQVWVRTGPFAEASALLERVFAKFEGRIEPHYLRAMGRSRSLTGRPDEAIAVCRPGAEEALAAGDISTAAHLLLEVANCLRETGRGAEAAAPYERAHHLFLRADEELGAAITEFSLGLLLFHGGDADGAVVRYACALESTKRHGAIRTRAAMLCNFANLRADQGIADEAMAMYRESKDLFDASGDTARVGHVFSNMGRLKQDLGLHDEARRLYAQGLEIHRESGNEGFSGLTLTNMAEIDAIAGRLPLALAQLREARGLLTRADWRRELGAHESVYGDVLRRLGRMEEAERAMISAEAVVRAGGRGFMLARILLRRAVLLREQGRHAQAEAMLDECDVLAEEARVADDSPLRKIIAAQRHERQPGNLD